MWTPKIRVPKVPKVPRVKGLAGAGKSAGKSVAKAPRSAAKKLVSLFKSGIRRLLAIPRAILRSPLGAYRKLVAGRDWVFAKIEYLNGESAKWKRTFNIIKSPYSFLRMMGFSPQMAAGVLAIGSTVGGGVVVHETIIDRPPSFAAGVPGIYNAPLDKPLFTAREFNTLRLDLGLTPIGLVQIEDVTVGTAYTGSTLPHGETNAVIVGGKPASSNPTFAETYLEVGHMTVDRWRCTKLTLTNIQAHNLIVKDNASDGQSISATAGTPRDRAISGGNRADDMLTAGGYYDQLKITSASSGVNGKVDRLVLSNVWTKGGPCVLDRIKAGTLEIVLNEVGAGDGFGTKDFTIATSVVYKSFVNEDNVEVTIAQAP